MQLPTRTCALLLLAHAPTVLAPAEPALETRQTATQTASGILNLPAETLFHIYRQLDPKDQVSFARTCRTAYKEYRDHTTAIFQQTGVLDLGAPTTSAKPIPSTFLTLHSRTHTARQIIKPHGNIYAHPQLLQTT